MTIKSTDARKLTLYEADCLCSWIGDNRFHTRGLDLQGVLDLYHACSGDFGAWFKPSDRKLVWRYFQIKKRSKRRNQKKFGTVCGHLECEENWIHSGRDYCSRGWTQCEDPKCRGYASYDAGRPPRKRLVDIHDRSREIERCDTCNRFADDDHAHAQWKRDGKPKC